MYILDWILKKIFPNKLDEKYNYDPLVQNTEEEEDCDHEFMPVDSTGEVLACIKCGFIVKRNGNNITKDEEL